MTSTQIKATTDTIGGALWLKEIALQLAIFNESRSRELGPQPEKWPGVTWDDDKKTWDQSIDATA